MLDSFNKANRLSRTRRTVCAYVRLVLFLSCLLSASLCRAAPQEARRLISLAPSMTELLVALEVPVVGEPSQRSDSSQRGGPLLVAVSDYCDYPASVRHLPRVGSLANPHFEQIVSLKPDAIFGVSDGAEIAARATALGITPVFAPQRTFAELFSSITRVAEVVGRLPQGAALIAKLKAAVQQAALPQAKGQKALVLFWESLQEASVYAAGSGSLDEDLLHAVGLENALQSRQPYVQLSLEGILSLKPALVIIVAPGIEEATARKRIEEFRTTLQVLPAVRDNKILLLNSTSYVRPGPRTIETLAALRQGVKELLE